MGLGIGQAHWSYSGFNSFRMRLAEHEGFDLRAMEGFDGTRPWAEVSSPLQPLLAHADDEGVLTPAECAQMYTPLTRIVNGWAAESGDMHDYDVEQGRLLAQSMLESVASCEDLAFR
jgi:hypothetical protein